MKSENKENLGRNGIEPNIRVSLVNRRTMALLLSVVILFSVINPVVLAASSRGFYDSSVIWVEDVDSGDVDDGDIDSDDDEVIWVEDVDSGFIDSGEDTPDVDVPNIDETELVDSGVRDSGKGTRAVLLADVYVGTGGNDNNSGVSEATRVLSLDAAFSKVRNGGTIHVRQTAAFIQVWQNYANDVNKSCTVQGMNNDKNSVFEIRQRLVFGGAGITFKNITIRQMTSAGGLDIKTGAALDVAGSGFVLDNADIVGSSYSRTGVLRTYNGGTIRMKNGSKITGCNSGNILEASRGTIVMEPGSEISGCTGTTVKIASGQNLTLEGTIKDNNGRGVDIADNAGSIKIGSGAVVANNISGGKPANMSLGANNQIQILNSLTPDTDINLTPHASMTSGTVIATGADANAVQCFKLENKKVPTYNLALKGSELQLVQEMFVKAGVPGGDGSMANPLSSLSEALRLSESTKDPIAINLLSDMTTTGQLLINKNIVLQGRSDDNTDDVTRTIKRAVGYDSTAIQVTGGTTELKNITVDGENRGTAPLLRINGGTAEAILGENSKLCNNTGGGASVDAGTLTMKDKSTINGNSVASGMGDGIYVAQAGVLNLYGGVIALGSGSDSKAGDIYGGGTINISGAPMVADIHLPVAKSIKIVGELTGAANSIGFTVLDPEPTENMNRMRVFATGSENEGDLGRFKWNDKLEVSESEFGPEQETRRIGTDLAITNYRRDARLSSLTRDGILAVGEAAPVVPDGFKGLGSTDHSDEEATFEIPYSVGKITMTVRAELNDAAYATVTTDTLVPTTRDTFAGGRPIAIDVPYDPTKIAVGDEVAKLTMKATSHLGKQTKQYDVSFVRGAPKLTGNNTVNVNFDSDDDKSPVVGSVVIDKLRGAAVIDSGRFVIRTAESDPTGATDNIEGLKVISFDNTKGVLKVEVTRAFADGNVTAVNAVISAGRKDYNLWLDSKDPKGKKYNLGKIIINMTKASGKLVGAFTEISSMDWGVLVYPKNVYIRAEDVPTEEDRAWPSDGINLLDEDDNGNWGYIDEQGNFVELKVDIPDITGDWKTYVDQVGEVKRKLEKEATAMVEETITAVAAKRGVAPPEVESKGKAGRVDEAVYLPAYDVKVTSEYKPAINPDPYNLPQGQTGLYTFRIDIILKGTGGGAGVGVAGEEHTIPVHPKKFEGIKADELIEAIRNGKTGALDGPDGNGFDGEIWVNPNASADVISQAVIADVFDKTGSPIDTALKKLNDNHKDWIVAAEINPEDDAPLETDGVNTMLYLEVSAYKDGCETNPDGTPKEKCITRLSQIPVKINIKTNLSETSGQIITRHAEKEIRDALNTGKLTLGDIVPNAEQGKTEAGAMAYVRDKVTAAITTPAGATLNSSLTTNGKPDGNPVASVVLKEPLSKMVKVNVRRRALEQDAYRAAVNGNYINRTGVQGQYAFDITVTTLDGAQTKPVALTHSGSPVKAMLEDGGSPFDNGIALLAEEYKTPGGGGGSGGGGSGGGSGSGGVKPGDIEVSDPNAKPGVGEVTRPGTAGGRLPGQTGTGGQGGTTGTGTGTGSGAVVGLGVGGTMLSQAKNVTITVPALTQGGIKAVLPNMEAVLRALLTPNEIKAAQDGESVEIELKVNRIADKDLSGAGNDDQVTIKTEAQKRKLVIGCYLDITLGKKISGGEWLSVTEAGEAIRVTLDIPDELQKDGRVYSVARRHSGVVSFLPNLSTDKKTVTFETDRFSTYAIVYSDTAVEAKAEGEAETGAKAETDIIGGGGTGQNGADMNIALLGGCLLAGAVVVLVAVILLVRRRKRV